MCLELPGRHRPLPQTRPRQTRRPRSQRRPRPCGAENLTGLGRFLPGSMPRATLSPPIPPADEALTDATAPVPASPATLPGPKPNRASATFVDPNTSLDDLPCFAPDRVRVKQGFVPYTPLCGPSGASPTKGLLHQPATNNSNELLCGTDVVVDICFRDFFPLRHAFEMFPL